MRLIITRHAKADLNAIAYYTTLQWGKDQAMTYLDELYHGIETVYKNPETGNARYGVPKVIKGYACGKHIIFFRIKDKTLYILRILHQRLDHGKYVE